VDINASQSAIALNELAEFATHENQLHSIIADAADEVDVKAFVDETLAKYGRIDIAILNAGIVHKPSTIMDTSEDVWDQTMRVNARSPYLGIRYIAPTMIKNGIKGSFVLTSSVAGLQGKPWIGAYCASKWAVKCIAVTAAQELGPKGIRVNCICPGATVTPMTIMSFGATFDGDSKTKLSLEVPLGHYAHPSEIAGAMAFLSSEDASYVRYHFENYLLITEWGNA
jgi:NAD(P)-dependent dehydrogenase (short-subunit alcohol dehydrogenase family)